jgi:ankyrin repeat protein
VTFWMQLLRAASSNNEELVSFLVSQGANVYCTDAVR